MAVLLNIFSNHLLPAGALSAEPVLRPDPWPTIIICASLFLLTLIVVPFRRKLSLILRSLFSQRHFSLMVRESKILEERVFVFTLLFDLMVFALGILLLARKYYVPIVAKLSEIGVFGILFVVLLFLYFLKFFGNYIYSILFDHPKERYYINLYKFVFLTLAATTLYPILIVIYFTGCFPLLYVYIPIFVAYVIVLLYKLLKINPRHINLFQFFLYFCTLEILPYVLLVKFVSMF